MDEQLNDADDPEITAVAIPKPPAMPREARETRDTEPELIVQLIQEVRGYRSELVDPGKTLDRFGASLRKEFEELRTALDGSLRLLWGSVKEDNAETRDLLTALSLRVGLIEKPSGPPENVVVLIVDDDRQVRELLAKHCHSRGMKVFIADGADEAERVLSENPVDVVLTDVAMPRNGKGLAEFIRTEHQGVELIIMSGYPDVATQAEEMGAFFFLRKPFQDIGNEGVSLMIRRAAERRWQRRHGPRR